MLLFYDGAIVCDCEWFHQYGGYCKHAFCLVRSREIDFTVSLALDKAYRDASNVDQDSSKRAKYVVVPNTRFKVTKPWHWANQLVREGHPRLAVRPEVPIWT